MLRRKRQEIQWEHRNNSPANQIQKTPTKQQLKRKPREGREEIRTEKKSGHDSRNTSLKTQNCQSRQFNCVVYRFSQPGKQCRERKQDSDSARLVQGRVHIFSSRIGSTSPLFHCRPTCRARATLLWPGFDLDRIIFGNVGLEILFGWRSNAARLWQRFSSTFCTTRTGLPSTFCAFCVMAGASARPRHVVHLEQCFVTT